jgi:hypothetical protein
MAKAVSPRPTETGEETMLAKTLAVPALDDVLPTAIA